MYRRWYAGLGVSVLIGLVALWLGSTDLGVQLESRTLDYRFRRFDIADRADTNIVLVAIDNQSLDLFSKRGISWPWPRDFYAHATDYFAGAGASAVLFDLQFYERDLDRDETDAAETDGAFAQAIRANGRVVLAAALTLDSADSGLDADAFALPLEGGVPAGALRYRGVKAPTETLRAAARALGIVNIRPDRDGILRRVPLVYALGGAYYPQMGLSAWLLDGEKGSPIRFGRSRLHVGGRSIPTDPLGRYLVNWYGSAGADRIFRTFSFSAVVQSASAVESGLAPGIAPETFRGKYVIVGATGSGIEDLIPSPFVEPYPGMELWATVLSNLIHQDFIRAAPWWLNLMHAVLVAFLTFLLFTLLDPRVSHAALIVVLLYAVGCGPILWAGYRFVLSITMPLVGFVLAYAYTATASYVTEGRSKRSIRKVFSRYVSPQVMERVLEDPESVTFGGDEVDATVFFSDLYDFMGLSEGRSPAALFELLNQYFDRFTRIILEHDGLLDKYTGDGVMALFGVPVAREDHAVLACRAALCHRELALRLSRSPGSTQPAAFLHLNTRIGISSGRIVVGNIGSSLRMDYTAIGESVNLAARLQAANKIYKTYIVVGPRTHELIGDGFVCRELDRVTLKGKSHPTVLYELVAEKGGEGPEGSERIGRYHDALTLYRQGEWGRAGALFAELAEGPLEDPPSRVMLERCVLLAKHPPDEWDGVFPTGG